MSSGFDPRSSKLLIEVLVTLVVVAALGVGVIVAGGRVAAWATPLVPWGVDHKLGELSQQQMSLMSEECQNPAPLAYVQAIAAPLIQAAGPLPFQFQFRVVNTDEVNAFALPGGFVTVNFGLLAAAQSGEEVAGVLGHEIQHALLRHGTKRMLRQMGSGALMLLLFGGGDLHSLGQTAGQLASLSHDRDEESEADHHGVELLVRAHINPRGLASFFERLSKDAIQPPEILSTHPDPGNRAALVARAAQHGQFQPVPSPRGLSCSLR